MFFTHFPALLEHNPYADLRVNLKNDTFVMVSKFIMHAHNEWFHNLLSPDLTIAEIDCLELTFVEMNLYLRYMLSNNGFQITAQNIYQMINIYNVFRIPSIERDVTCWILGNELIPMEIFTYCKDKCLPSLLKPMKEHFNIHFEIYMENDHFNNVGYNIFIEIFDTNFTFSKCQDTMFVFFVQWLNSNFNSRKHFFLEVIKGINFQYISFDFAKRLPALYKKIFEIDEVACFLYAKIHSKMKCTIPNNPQAEEVLIGKYNFSSLITFLVSESNDVFAYNIDTEISRPFGVIQTNFYSFGCERVDNDLFVFGKEDMDSSDNSGEDKIFGIDKFSLESRKTKFCYARSYPTNLYSCSAKVNNEIMVFGRNRKDYFDPPSNMTILDIPSMKWRKGPSLPVNISLQSSVVLNNSVYGIGGLSHAALRYDLREGLWTTLPMSIIGLDYSAVCQYNNTDIMKAGGHMPIFNENLRVNFIEANNGCEIFDTRANSWRRTSNLPMPVHNAKCCQIKETVVLFGGKTEEEILQDIHAYNIAEETWTRNDSELCNIEDLHSIHLI